jgi:hypothetical protein
MVRVCGEKVRFGGPELWLAEVLDFVQRCVVWLSGAGLRGICESL